MDLSVPNKLAKLTPETKAFINEYCGENLSEADLLEIKESLFHLGEAIYLYHLQMNGGCS